MSVFDAFTDITLNFSDLIGTPIINEEKNKIGSLTDFFVNYEDIFPEVLALQFKKNNQVFYIRWEHILSFSRKKIIIRNESPVGRSRTFPKICQKKTVTNLMASQFLGQAVEYPPLGKVILDRQIVDTHGKKVVRVNDIQFIRVGQNIRVTHAEIGMRSLLRRLGFEKLVDFFVKIINPNAKYLTGNLLISWKYVHAIPDKTVHSNVRLNLKNDELNNLHPADLADILEDLDPHSRDLIFKELDPEMAAETLIEVEPEIQPMLLKFESPERVADIIENMGTDEAADILEDLSHDIRERIFENIEDDEIQEDIQELLEYDEDTAGGLMSTEFLTVKPEHTKYNVMQIIQDEHDDIETLYELYIIDDAEKLIGTCPLNKLLLQKEDLQVGDLMTTNDIKCLTPDTHWKEVANYMSKYNLFYVPVVEKDNTLLGVVFIDDVLPWLLD